MKVKYNGIREPGECGYCHKQYLKYAKHQKYCCSMCARLAQPYYQNRKQYIKKCVVCGNEIITFHKHQIYCSAECYRKTQVLKAKKNYESKTPPCLKMRFQVFERDHFKCQYCGRGVPDGAVLEVDHFIPKSKGGLDKLSNFVTACSDCNLGKSDALLDAHKEAT